MPVSRKYGFTPKKAGYTIWATKHTSSKKRSGGKPQKGLGDVLLNAAFQSVKQSLRNSSKPKR